MAFPLRFTGMGWSLNLLTAYVYRFEVDDEIIYNSTDAFSARQILPMLKV